MHRKMTENQMKNLVWVCVDSSQMKVYGSEGKKG